MDSVRSGEFDRALGEVHAALTSGGRRLLELDIGTFGRVYRHLHEQELLSDKQVFGILLGRRALLWFPAKPELEFYVVGKRRLSQQDFAFVLRAHLVGATEGTYSFGRFVVEEARSWRTWLAALLSAAAALALFFGAPEGSSADVVAATIPAVALFASVFVLFAVSQRTISEREAVLLKSNVYHRYGQIDKYVAWVLATGLLAGVASLVGTAVEKEPLSDYVGSAAFTLSTLGIAIFAVTWGITSLIGFYFERSAVIQHLTAVPALKDILQKEYEPSEETRQ